QVRVRRAPDGAAEHVGEEQQEHHRLDAEVDQLGRVVLDLHQRPPAQRERLPQPLERADPRRQGPRIIRNRTIHNGAYRGHAALPSSSSVRWPVSDRNTSSRLDPRRVSSATVTPMSSSRRTTAGITSSPLTGTLTVVLRTSGSVRVNPATTASTAGRSAGLAG